MRRRAAGTRLAAYSGMAYAPSGVAHPGSRPWPFQLAAWRPSRRLRRAIVFVATLVLCLWAATLVVREPLRRLLERRINASLTGYTGSIGKVDLHVLGGALTLHDVTVVQNALPSPPTIYIPRWTTSVHWSALLSGALVADVVFDRPALYVTVQQAAGEAADPTPITDHGWQDAVTAVYPLEVNQLKIVDGALYYWDKSGPVPVHLTRYSLAAKNIRNVRSVAGRYPSPVEFDGTLADGARLRFDGRADFLATPHATIRGKLAVRKLTLVGLRPALRAADVEVNGGTLEAGGLVEYTPKQLRLALQHVRLDGAKIDYVERNAQTEQRMAAARKAATTAEAEPATRVDVHEAIARNASVGIVNRTGDTPYRLAIDGAALDVRGFSNQRNARRGSATLRGRFMGHAPFDLRAEFAPVGDQPDFKTDLRIEDVDLVALNDFLRAQAGIDVTSGRLALYSEVAVRDGRVDGYVKPLFSDITVYDREQDKGKPPFHQVYEAMIGAASHVLTNRPHDQVATMTSLSGPVESPSSSTSEVVGNLLRNAFIKAILPGLEPTRR